MLKNTPNQLINVKKKKKIYPQQQTNISNGTKSKTNSADLYPSRFEALDPSRAWDLRIISILY